MSQGITGLGHTVYLDGSTIAYRTKKLERQARQKHRGHIWVYVVTHRLSEKAAKAASQGDIGLLDTETLVGAGGPMCFRCEAVGYTTDPCPGYREIIRAEDVDAIILEGNDGD